MKRSVLILLGAFVALAALLLVLHPMLSQPAMAEANADCVAPSDPFVYAFPDSVGKIGVCSSEAQVNVNGIDALTSTDTVLYNWVAEEVLADSGDITVTAGNNNIAATVWYLDPNEDLDLAAASFHSAGGLSVVEYPRVTVAGTFTDVVEVTGFGWSLQTLPVTKELWFWTDGAWTTAVSWSEHTVLAFVGDVPVSNDVCSTLLPTGNWVFANPSMIYGGELGACADVAAVFNGVPGTKVPTGSIRPYNWRTDSLTGTVEVFAAETVLVEVTQIPEGEVLSTELVTFTAPFYPISVVSYDLITDTNAVMQVHQITGWQWDFSPAEGVTVGYWDYEAGVWSDSPAWRDHMIVRFVRQVETVYSTYLPIVMAPSTPPTPITVNPTKDGNEHAMNIDLPDGESSLVHVSFTSAGTFYWGSSIWVQSAADVTVKHNGILLNPSWVDKGDFVETGINPNPNQIQVAVGDTLEFSIRNGTWMNLIYRFTQ